MSAAGCLGTRDILHPGSIDKVFASQSPPNTMSSDPTTTATSASMSGNQAQPTHSLGHSSTERGDGRAEKQRDEAAQHGVAERVLRGTQLVGRMGRSSRSPQERRSSRAGECPRYRSPPAASRRATRWSGPRGCRPQWPWCLPPSRRRRQQSPSPPPRPGIRAVRRCPPTSCDPWLSLRARPRANHRQRQR